MCTFVSILPGGVRRFFLAERDFIKLLLAIFFIFWKFLFFDDFFESSFTRPSQKSSFFNDFWWFFEVSLCFRQPKFNKKSKFSKKKGQQEFHKVSAYKKLETKSSRKYPNERAQFFFTLEHKTLNFYWYYDWINQDFDDFPIFSQL